MKLIFRWYMSN